MTQRWVFNFYLFFTTVSIFRTQKLQVLLSPFFFSQHLNILKHTLVKVSVLVVFKRFFLQKSVDVEVKVIDLLLCFCFTQHFGGTVVWKSLWKSDDWTRLSVETFLNQRRKKKLLKWPLGRCWRICSRIGWGVRGWAETLPVETGGLIVVVWLEQCYTTAPRLSVVVGKPLTEVTGSNENKKPQ